MYFYKQLEKLCQKEGIKPSTLVESLGMSKGTMSNWKRGGIPNAEAVVRIAEHFSVPTDYLLLGKDFYSEEEQDELIYVSDFEKKLIETYRNYKEDGFSEQIMKMLTNFFPEITSSEFNAISTISQENIEITLNDKELLDLFHQLPERNQIKLIGYVERITQELFGGTINSSKKSRDNYDWVDWDKIMNEKPSVAADEPEKTETTNSVK